MWSSPKGGLWVVDDQGDVFTSATVSFDKPPYKLLKFDSGNSDVRWQVTEAFKGQLNGIWGTSNSNVWVTSFAGPVLNWNGKTWQQYELPEAPNAIDGSCDSDVYVVGYHGNIHHFNGNIWSKISVPKSVKQDDAFTDVKVISEKLVYITGRSGALLVGNAKDGFTDKGDPSYSWYGVGSLDNRIFLAGGQAGIFELIDDDFVCLKDKGYPVGVFETPNKIHFIPAEQQPEPWYVTYQPKEEREWIRVITEVT